MGTHVSRGLPQMGTTRAAETCLSQLPRMRTYRAADTCPRPLGLGSKAAGTCAPHGYHRWGPLGPQTRVCVYYDTRPRPREHVSLATTSDEDTQGRGHVSVSTSARGHHGDMCPCPLAQRPPRGHVSLATTSYGDPQSCRHVSASSSIRVQDRGTRVPRGYLGSGPTEPWTQVEGRGDTCPEMPTSTV